MAYRILNSPRRFGVWTFVGTCDCGCEFECDEADLVEDRSTSAVSQAATCPACGRVVPRTRLRGTYFGQQSLWLKNYFTA